MGLYIYQNGPMQTTSSFVPVTSGTNTRKTMLQLKPGATQVLTIKRWGISGDASAAATPGIVELVEVDVAATVTAAVANDFTKLDAKALLAGDPTTSMISVGTTATGYTASVEGTITATRNLDSPKQIAPTNMFEYEWSLGEEGIIQPAKFARIIVKFATAVNLICWVEFET